MKHHSGHPLKKRSVAQTWIFFPLSLVALAALLYTPLIGAGQPIVANHMAANHAFAFHRHLITMLPASRAARPGNSEERQNSEDRHFTILPQPVPIAGGINLPPLIHVFAPSDLDTEPNVITNFKGFSALAFPTGTNAARDNHGNFYDMSNDMRVFQGEYVAADGSHHIGTFVFIWIDLYQPGSGFSVQFHDFNGGIQPSGLFWVVQVPDDALEIEGHTAELNVEHAPVIDDFQFFAPGGVPGTVSIHMKWTASGDVHHHEPGSTDASNFDGDFRPAVATGTFSGSELGFSFSGSASSEGMFAEMGHERNGVFLKK